MEIVIGIVALLLGLIIGYVVLGKTTLNRAKTQAKAILEAAKKDADLDKKAKIFEAKEDIVKLKSEGSRSVKKKENELRDTLNRAKQKEQSLNDKFNNIKRRESEIENKRRNLDQQVEALNKKNDAVDKLRNEEIERLEKVAGLSQDDAREQMLAAVKQKSKNQAIAMSKQIIDEAKLNAVKESKKIVLQTIQRTAAETAVENTTSNFHIQNDEVKGRIIGREGRNIRAIEAATGVELIIDDTPETIILSCFDSVRREVARLALHRLVSDGRIHPGRIEEVVNKTKKDMENELMEIGERTVVDLGIVGLHPKLIRMVGRMRYRSSYGQNLLKHSREVANLCATMAAEMGLDAKKAKRAGLLHDIGKVHEDDAETPHALSGMALAQKYGEKDDVCNAIGAHHDEIEMTTMLAPVIQACDAISGARPGARRESTQSYIQRLKDLEDIAYGFKHVEKVFAFQAGRELRVMVDSEKTSDKDSENLSFEISQKIMKEMTFPGQIKVTVIREKRSVNVAK